MEDLGVPLFQETSKSSMPMSFPLWIRQTYRSFRGCVWRPKISCFKILAIHTALFLFFTSFFEHTHTRTNLCFFFFTSPKQIAATPVNLNLNLSPSTSKKAGSMGIIPSMWLPWISLDGWFHGTSQSKMHDLGLSPCMEPPYKVVPTQL